MIWRYRTLTSSGLIQAHSQGRIREGLECSPRLFHYLGHLTPRALITGLGCQAGVLTSYNRINKKLNGCTRWTACIIDLIWPADDTVSPLLFISTSTSFSKLTCLWFKSRIFLWNWIPSMHSCQADWSLLPTEASFCATEMKTRTVLWT